MALKSLAISPRAKLSENSSVKLLYELIEQILLEKFEIEEVRVLLKFISSLAKAESAKYNAD